jgi:hypothetical protein
MTARRRAGLALGLVLSLVLAAPAQAGQISDHLFNAHQGWNSPIYHATWTGFNIRFCTSSLGSLKFDAMHHWPGFPSTGTRETSISCQNNATWRAAVWDTDTADWSVEYTWNNSGATFTADYLLNYF